MGRQAIQYAITDRLLLADDEPGRRAALLRQAEFCASEGVDFLQLREKDLPANDLIALARSLRERLQWQGGRTRLLVNATPEVARAAGADGVHLSSALLSQTSDRPIGFLVSVSAHTLEDVQHASTLADIILFGPIFEKRVQGTVVQPGSGLQLLERAARVAGSTPLLALGGITQENAADCLHAGASGIAGIRMFVPPAE